MFFFLFPLVTEVHGMIRHDIINEQKINETGPFKDIPSNFNLYNYTGDVYDEFSLTRTYI